MCPGCIKTENGALNGVKCVNMVNFSCSDFINLNEVDRAH